MCVCVCVCVCARARARTCVCVCVRWGGVLFSFFLFLNTLSLSLFLPSSLPPSLPVGVADQCLFYIYNFLHFFSSSSFFCSPPPPPPPPFFFFFFFFLFFFFFFFFSFFFFLFFFFFFFFFSFLFFFFYIFFLCFSYVSCPVVCLCNSLLQKQKQREEFFREAETVNKCRGTNCTDVDIDCFYASGNVPCAYFLLFI